jgi:RHH-type transcriptional regulator, proline utilization regulon repressor / proline dehydrogenase / delta 1-pyrroline-5-carboxylate dehydrogenase
MFTLPPASARLPAPCTAAPSDELRVLQTLLAGLQGALNWPQAMQAAKPWVQAVRDNPPPFWAMESLLREYPISSAEGLALMRLAEALLRVPDLETAVALTADQLGNAQFDASSGGPHQMLASLSASAIAMSKKFLPENESEAGVFKRLGAQTVVAATVRAIQLLGKQFVLGRNIKEAMGEATAARKSQRGLRFSYDMLGEGARTEADAQRYLASYLNAIHAIAASGDASRDPTLNDGISIKLSALFSRYEDSQRDRVFAELLPRVWQLIEPAAKANLNLTIDAEESDRLELSLDVLDALAEQIAKHFPQWCGFGLAVQAYQLRAPHVVQEVARIAKQHGLRFMVRLVKGAYWDGEIKRAQELGLSGYPVFTHKHHTDIAYLACAQALFAHSDVIYPQFATHNAGTIAAILHMASGAPFEMQRLHGMGEGIYREVMRNPAIAVRVYAPVGEHRDLLAYLVRRLLENGANSSFVHQLTDSAVDVEALLSSPLTPATHAAFAQPIELFGWNGSTGRANSKGVDLSVIAQREPLLKAVAATRIQAMAEATPADVSAAMARLQQGFQTWIVTPLNERAAVLRRAADALEARMPEFCGLLVKEAHKTLGDCVSEVREAVDFCRYYADQAEVKLKTQVLPGPTGESNELHLHGRGVFVCISPWNFPLAIFAGQVVAALVAGNSVAAKPAEQTPFVAQRFVDLLVECGVPNDALMLLHGPGETVGAALVSDARTAGVCFTGSTAVAKIINRTLAARDGAMVPLIAETGGINAMIVDSTALPEQVVDAVVQSAFRSAGQRCSALRLLCVHAGIADGVIEMIRGALSELRVGDPALLATDVGPVIDGEAFEGISEHIARLHKTAKLIGMAPSSLTEERILAPSPLTGEGRGGGEIVEHSRTNPGAFTSAAHRASACKPMPFSGLGACASKAPPHPQPSPSRGGGNTNLSTGHHLISPIAFEVQSISDVKQEIFGPVLHVVRWSGDVDAVMRQINALGYGLTLGIQTRIDSRALRLAAQARIGNVYINRNMIGAAVGSQPFGGEGLSGTGPKAGGPHYLYRFCAEQTVTINTAAAGGNAALLAGLH